MRTTREIYLSGRPYGFGDEDDDKGGDKGGAGNDDLKAKIDAAVEEATQGLKNKNKELLGNLSETKKLLKNWEGLDPDEVKGMLDRLNKDEELKLMAEGKHEEAFAKRLEKTKATYQSQLDTLSSEADKYKTDLEKAQEQIRDLVIDQQVLGAFMKEKGLESAGPDVVNRAKAAFKIEDGVPIARDKDGEIVRGKDGAITISEWVASLKLSAPHLFPGSAGAGAFGGSGGGAGGDLTARMEAAAAAGDMPTYRKLREQAAKSAAGK